MAAISVARQQTMTIRLLLAWTVTLTFPGLVSADSNRILARLPLEVTADVVWHKQNVRIRRVISCNMRDRLYPLVWDQDVHRIYHVFPSKEVIIIQLPPVCGDLNKPPRGTSLTPLPQGYLPITYWVDNADSPKRAEEIVSSHYYENPRRHFEMRAFAIRKAQELSERDIDEDQRLVWLIQSSVRLDAIFHGVSATVIPASVWKEHPALSTQLERYTESGPVDRALLARDNLLALCTSAAQGVSPAERCLTGPFDSRLYQIGADLKDGVWRLGGGDFGVKRYVKYADVERSKSGACISLTECIPPNGTYRVEIGGQVREQPMRDAGAVFFDAHSRSLLIYRHYLSISTSNWEPPK